ncbi:Crp/Fnr family transcriptional regulator [Chitinophaga ginsengisoli]|uniref:CRP-like cAMP-binding protein n=1 Tax=Chitinophaga ginsengisoli TaxID=363837 RepID=A0A2P8G2F1_9BACT|nr:Crp/Fnr family transcriptional regulator [Chitinophaga ginsengisoli]PSL28126.1 CRP-like cAMP-binding protein [Chitinophaga ginsengisoli]
MSTLIDFDRLQQHLAVISGMSKEAFALSEPYWRLQFYRKGEFYNEYKNICKYLGFVVSGIFRIYRYEERTQTEKNMLFFSSGQLMTSYKSFLTQTACEYFTEAMTASVVIYIHHEKLQELYKTSHEWERFGRVYTELVLTQLLDATEALLFRTAEERYAAMLQQHPDLVQSIPLYHIASYLGIEGPSLSRIRKRLQKNTDK